MHPAKRHSDGPIHEVFDFVQFQTSKARVDILNWQL